MFRHAQTVHKDSHPNFKLDDCVLLDNVERYYDYITKLKKRDPQAQRFVGAVQYELQRPENQAISRSAKTSKEWRVLQEKIKNSKTILHTPKKYKNVRLQKCVHTFLCN